MRRLTLFLLTLVALFYYMIVIKIEYVDTFSQLIVFLLEFFAWPAKWFFELAVDSGGSGGSVTRVAATNTTLVMMYGLLVYGSCKNENKFIQEKWADSIYYLGFIITLFALIMALSGIRNFKNTDAVEAVIIQNAIALSSTVAALICRTLWRLVMPSNQSDLQYVERLRKSYEGLGQSIAKINEASNACASSMVSETKKLSTAFTNLESRINNFTLDEGVVSKQISSVMSEALSASRGEIKRLNDTISRAATTLDEEIRIVADNARTADFSEHLSGVLEKLVEPLNAEFAASSANFAKTIQDIDKQLGELGQINPAAIEKTVKIQNALAGTESALDALDAKIASTMSAVESPDFNPAWREEMRMQMENALSQLMSVSEQLGLIAQGLEQNSKFSNKPSLLGRMFSRD